MSDVRKIALLVSAARVLATMPLPPVQVKHQDREEPKPDPAKRAKVKAARKQKRKGNE